MLSGWGALFSGRIDEKRPRHVGHVVGVCAELPAGRLPPCMEPRDVHALHSRPLHPHAAGLGVVQLKLLKLCEANETYVLPVPVCRRRRPSTLQGGHPLAVV